MKGHEDIATDVARCPATRKFAAAAPDVRVRVLPLYERNPTPPKLRIAWGEQHPIDSEQAPRIKRLPTVIQKPACGAAAHASWLHLGDDRRPESLLQRILEF